MALNRDKFRKIVGGITTQAESEEVATASPVADAPPTEVPPGRRDRPSPLSAADEARTEDRRRFAKRGRPKGRRDNPPTAKTRKVKVSLFLSEPLVNDFYDWAHDDRIHPGEMFERALKPFHERETKRRNAGTE